jgi:F420-non-reducing hydrogenase iron-sulfur subunit
MEKTKFEPLIIAFCCNWCSYAGADLAGTSRFEYPTNVRIIRVMCSGRIDPIFILSAFRWGADGVLITGCHPGDCHYVKGNYMMERRFNFVKDALDHLGIEPERLSLEWISAGEGEKFTALIRDATRRIKDLGPSPLRP